MTGIQSIVFDSSFASGMWGHVSCGVGCRSHINIMAAASGSASGAIASGGPHIHSNCDLVLAT